MRWLLLVLVLVALAISGACTLFDEDPPGDTCASDSDCFRAQGEVCNAQTKRCVLRSVDAGVDAGLPDAAIDAAVDAL